MPTILKDRLTLFAKKHALFPDDLKRSLAHCIELASDPPLFEQLIETCALQNDYRLVEALFTCCDWQGSSKILLRTPPWV